MDQKVKPNFKVVAIETTEHWSDRVTALGKVLEVYFYDANKSVHCCSMTGSAECHFLYCIPAPTKEEDNEKLLELIEPSEPDLASEVKYMSWGQIESAEESEDVELTKEDVKKLATNEITYDELVEELKAECKCNTLI